MGSEWPLVSLAEISERIGDGLHGTPEYSEYGEYYFINGNNLENGEITIKESTKKVDSTEYLKHKKELNSNAVLVSINGTIGNVALFNGEEVVLGKSTCYINLKQGIHRDFVAYSLSSHQFQEYIERCATGSTIKNVSLKMMREFKFRMPVEETEQIKAVSSIRNLDNKIQLNRQTNKTLEAMAQALFKSWFVDFDPVFDNIIAHNLAHNNAPLHNIPEPLLPHAQRRLNVHNVGRGSARQTAAHAFHHLFPQAFEQSDEPSVGIQGWVPKGWGVSRLDSILELAYGRALKKTERLEGDIPVYGSGGMTGYHNDFLVPGPGIIVGRKGTVGSLYWEDKNFYPIDTVFYVKPMKQYSLEYCFMQLKVLGLENMNTDAAVPGLNRNNAYRLEIVKPEQKIIDKFSDIIKSFQCRKQALQSETENLESLRDTLLPKLISGELRIPDAEQATEALAK